MDDDPPFMGSPARSELVRHLVSDLDRWDDEDADWMLNTLFSAAWPTRLSQDH